MCTSVCMSFCMSVYTSVRCKTPDPTGHIGRITVLVKLLALVRRRHPTNHWLRIQSSKRAVICYWWFVRIIESLHTPHAVDIRAWRSRWRSKFSILGGARAPGLLIWLNEQSSLVESLEEQVLNLRWRTAAAGSLIWLSGLYLGNPKRVRLGQV